jgi:hypothetical protein
VTSGQHLEQRVQLVYLLKTCATEARSLSRLLKETQQPRKMGRRQERRDPQKASFETRSSLQRRPLSLLFSISLPSSLFLLLLTLPSLPFQAPHFKSCSLLRAPSHSFTIKVTLNVQDPISCQPLDSSSYRCASCLVPCPSAPPATRGRCRALSSSAES